MTRTKRADAPAEDQGEQLAAAVNRLADEVGILRQVLDEVRESFRCAVHNGKLCGAGGPPDSRHSPEIPVTPQLELAEGQFEGIAGTVQQSFGVTVAELPCCFTRPSLRTVGHRYIVTHPHGGPGPPTSIHLLGIGMTPSQLGGGS